MEARDPLTAQIERAILRETGLFVIVEEDGGVSHLTGLVDSPEARQAAEDIALQFLAKERLQNDLELEEVVPFDTESEDTLPTTMLGDEEIEPDFSSGGVLTDPISASGPSSSSSDDPVSEGNLVYFPPTDPVIRTDSDGQPEVLGGFSPTSDDSVEVERSALDGRPGDEALAEAILRELREDAATTSLEIEVVVREGIAHLYGRVPDLDDAQNAEEVARRVPGLVDVEDAIEVTEL
jgi:osmotically-inducible protein OsmY